MTLMGCSAAGSLGTSSQWYTDSSRALPVPALRLELTRLGLAFHRAVACWAFVTATFCFPLTVADRHELCRGEGHLPAAVRALPSYEH